VTKRPTDPKSLPIRTSKDWSTSGIRGYVLLLFEFLRISPSYALAQALNAKRITLAQAHDKLINGYKAEAGGRLKAAVKKSVLADFEKVIRTYKEFGDVYSTDFDTWWVKRGADIFGYDHAQPKVIQLARLGNAGADDNTIAAMVESYLKSEYLSQGKPEALVLAVPLGIPKRTLLAHISKLIDQAGVPTVPRSKKPKRQFAAQRLRSKPLFTYITLLMGKAISPQATLWQLGVKAKVSPTHAKGLSITGKKTSDTVYKRNVMAILTSRAMKNAKLIAENAAHGDFPSKAQRPLIEFDWDEVYERMRSARPQLRPRQGKSQPVVLNNKPKS
jgi:hypothetical protein